MADERWWFCLEHQRPERDGARCRSAQLMGPYASEAQALAWKDRAEARNDAWDDEDEAWQRR